MNIRKTLFAATLLAAAPQLAEAQSQLYPNHFDLSEVTLLDGPFKKAMDLNFNVLLQYDTDRLLTPFVRQAGLKTGRYADWEKKHPNFRNWGGDGFDLSGHVGGHYVSALALGYAACKDPEMKARLKERLDYVLAVLKDCQDAYDGNSEGMQGFIGGQPINDAWKGMYKNDLKEWDKIKWWVPFYCEHKVLAGLRDAYLYTGNEQALQMFRKLADWSINVVSNLSDETLQKVLDIEHGGMNESLADAYTLFKDKKYLDGAKRFSHQTMVNGMQTLNKSFLDNRHANTQVPKYIGFERISEDDATAQKYATAAKNFWQDVTENRTVCIGGNSISEHFLAAANGERYINNQEGPESCNTNNMLKLSEMLSDKTHDARYADFYEYAMWNHILSTQDPKTGGYVYFTSLRPQSYRIYSQPNEGMWCCVGTGMENHSKYGHFIYTHAGKDTLFVNLFTASKLDDKNFKVTQETNFPYEMKSKITVEKAGKYTIAVRHPNWTTGGYLVSVLRPGKMPNSVSKLIKSYAGEFNVELPKGKIETSELLQPNTNKETTGEASYVYITRKWKKGDVISVELPATLREEACPNYADYTSFEYGPILLGAQTTAVDFADELATGLQIEKLQNEFAGDGRMDHSLGAVGKGKSLIEAPMLVGNGNVLNRISNKDASKLQFTLDVSRNDALKGNYAWNKLTLRPFYEIQHSRYMCYWYKNTPEGYAKSDMALNEAARQALEARTIDYVGTGEQQSEAGHEYQYSEGSNKGSYRNEFYRDAPAGGYIQYSLFNKDGLKEGLSVMCRFIDVDHGRKASLLIDGVKVADIEIPRRVEGAENGIFNLEFDIPETLLKDKKGKAKDKFVVRLVADQGTMCPGYYYLRLLKK